MRVSFLVLFILISANCFSYSIVISDLDDTVRQAHVSNKVDALKRLSKGVKSFDHLKSIYYDIKDASTEETFFYYISASYKLIYDANKWLRLESFPEGEVFQRKSLSDHLFKIRIISEILGQHSRDQLEKIYFFGDNGEHDPEIYQTIIKQNDFKNSKVFIRDVATTARYWHDQLEVKKLNSIFYFFTEKELIGKVPEITALTKTNIISDFQERTLVADYVIGDLYKRFRGLCRAKYKFYTKKYLTCLTGSKKIVTVLIDNYYL